MDRQTARETLSRCVAERDVAGLRQLVNTLGEARDRALVALDHEHNHFRRDPSAHNWRQLQAAMLTYQDAHTRLSEGSAQLRHAISEWNLVEDVAINEAMRAAGYDVPPESLADQIEREHNALVHPDGSECPDGCGGY
jgi:hypothetical protein